MRAHVTFIPMYYITRVYCIYVCNRTHSQKSQFEKLFIINKMK